MESINHVLVSLYFSDEEPNNVTSANICIQKSLLCVPMQFKKGRNLAVWKCTKIYLIFFSKQGSGTYTFTMSFGFKMLQTNTLYSHSTSYLKHNAYSTALSSFSFVCIRRTLDFEQPDISFSIFASLNLEK